MRKWLYISLLAVLSLCFARPAAAQGSLANFIVWRYTPSGAFPASGATVTICTASATGMPCSPTVTVYQDSALSIPVANPLAACTTSPQIGCLDGLGNATFYATPGNYSYSVTGAGLNPYSVPFGLPCVVGVSCLSNPTTVAVVINSPGSLTDNGPATFTNNISASQTGVYTSGGQYPYTFLLGGINPNSEYHTITNNTTLNTTEGLSAGVAVPSGAAVYQANGIAGYANCATITTNCVGVYGQARPTVNGHQSIWASNFVASDIGYTGAINVVASEMDTNATQSATIVQGIQLNGTFTAQPTSALGVRCSQLQGTGKWTTCFSTDSGASTGIGVNLGAIGASGTTNSQQLALTGMNAGVSEGSFMDVDNLGNFRFYPAASAKGFSFQVGSALTPRGTAEWNVGSGACPDALNVNLASGFNLTDGGNTGMSFGMCDTAPIHGWIQARNTVGASNTSYPLALNPLGGNVQVAAPIQNIGGTATMGLTVKKGSGSGNYTSASTSFTAVDGTNLTFTVTVPTGWKLGMQVSGAMSTLTATATASVILYDGTCGSGTAYQQTQVNPTAAGNNEAFSLSDVLVGDGASHTINLCYATSAGADSVSMLNSSASASPRMVFTLMPSN